MVNSWVTMQLIEYPPWRKAHAYVPYDNRYHLQWLQYSQINKGGKLWFSCFTVKDRNVLWHFKKCEPQKKSHSWKSQGLSFFSFLLINALKKCVTLFLVNNQLQKETILSTVFNHLFHCDNSSNKKQTVFINLISIYQLQGGNRSTKWFNKK